MVVVFTVELCSKSTEDALQGFKTGAEIEEGLRTILYPFYSLI